MNDVVERVARADRDAEIAAIADAHRGLSTLSPEGRYRASAYIALRSAQELLALPKPDLPNHKGTEIVPAFGKVRWVCHCGWKSCVGIEGEPFAEASWRTHAITMATLADASPDIGKEGIGNDVR